MDHFFVNPSKASDLSSLKWGTQFTAASMPFSMIPIPSRDGYVFRGKRGCAHVFVLVLRLTGNTVAFLCICASAKSEVAHGPDPLT